MLGEGYPRPLLIGIVVSFVGVAIIAVAVRPADPDGLGLLLGLATAVLYAAGVLSQKVALRAPTRSPPPGWAAWWARWCCCRSPGWRWTELGPAPWSAILAVVYLGVFPTAVGFALWAYALTRTEAGAMAATTLSIPGIVVLMSWALLGELPTLAALVGGTLCLLGVAVRGGGPGGALSRVGVRAGHGAGVDHDRRPGSAGCSARWPRPTPTTPGCARRCSPLSPWEAATRRPRIGCCCTGTRCATGGPRRAGARPADRDDRFDVELALRACRWLGRAVLAARSPDSRSGEAPR